MAATLQTDQRPAPDQAPPAEPAEASRSASRLSLLLLAPILALALGLRLSGLGWGLPWAFHPDEIFYVDQAQDLLKFGDPNPKYFKNPSLLTYLLAGEYALVRALGPLAGPLALSEPGTPYFLARLTSALLGVASVALIFAIGATLFDRRIGLLAALLLGVSFLHVRDSHFGVNDVPATALLLLSLYFDARLLGRPEPRWYLLAGLAGGLATSTKYNLGFFFVPLLAAHLLAWREQGTAESAGRLSRLLSPRSIGCLMLGGLASLAGYAVGTPYTLLDFRRFSADFLTQYHYGDQRWLGQSLEPVPLLYLTSLLQGFGALPLVLALVGLVAAWRSRRPAAMLLLALPLVYLTFLLPKALFFPRFTIPLIPPFCLFAAVGVVSLTGRLPKSWRAAGLAGLLALALIQPLRNDLLHNRLLYQPDTRILANEWVQANLPPGSRVKVEDYSLRDLSTQSRTYTPNTAELKIERFEGSPEAESVRAFVDKNVQYIVTSSFAYDRYLLDPPLRGQQETGERYQRLHRSLEQRAEPVARFSPGHDNAELPYRLDDVLTPFWGLEQYERPGPTVRIYALPPQ